MCGGCWKSGSNSGHVATDECVRGLRCEQLTNPRLRHDTLGFKPNRGELPLKKVAASWLLIVLLQGVVLAQTAGGSSTAEKPAPKITYILAGRLFDATSDSVRQNVVITVEGERIKSVASSATRELEVLNATERLYLPRVCPDAAFMLRARLLCECAFRTRD